MKNEKIIEEMAKDICKLTDCSLLKCMPDKHCTSYRYAQRAVNANYRKQSEWISVEDRLPEKEQIVLCCLGLVMNVYTYKGDNTWEDSYGYWQKDEPITHWMPLPEPPKMKGGAE